MVRPASPAARIRTLENLKSRKGKARRRPHERQWRKTMALGLTYNTGGGDFTAIMKYDARAGRMFREDRKQADGGAWVKDSVDVTNIFKAVFDFENIEVGYINFPQGGAPDFQMVALGDPMPQRPSQTHNQGVRFMLKLSKDAAGDGAAIRELAGTSAAFRMGVDELHDAYETQKAANRGKLPIVALKTTLPITSGSGTKKSTNYQPVFEIVGRAPRRSGFRTQGADKASRYDHERGTHYWINAGRAARTKANGGGGRRLRLIR
jgi:hypothetical protein